MLPWKVLLLLLLDVGSCVWAADDDVVVQVEGKGETFSLTLAEVKDALDIALKEFARLEPYPTLPSDGPRYSPSLRHQRNRPVHPDALLLDAAQRSYEDTLLLLIRRNKASKTKVQHALSKLELGGLEPVSQNKPLCDKLYPETCKSGQPYRSLDGSCNNLGQPAWGRALGCHARIAPAAFGDDVASPRTKGKSGQELPNARLVSNAIRGAPPDPLRRRPGRHTNLFMAFGQLVDHDIALTPDVRGPNNSLLQCCGDQVSPDCFPVRVSDDDPFFGPLNVKCLNVVRSSGCTDCSGFHERRFVNQQTAYLDASHVYGTSAAALATLRDKSQPELLLLPNGILPPSLNPTEDGCSDPSSSQFCFRAGDGRVNQQPGIASLHILYARQHNRLAKELGRTHPDWDKETVFQEARRILVAQHQHIIYREFVPEMLGYRRSAALGLDNPWERTQYEPSRDASILVEFTTAAFRFGHGLIEDFTLVDCRGAVTAYPLSDRFFLVQDLYQKGTLDRIMRGLCLQAGRVPGPSLSNSVGRHLYRNSTSEAGLDLASIDMQRGRDHAIPGYGHLLRRYMGRQVQSFDQLAAYMPEGRVQVLRDLYEHPDDVDLWAAGLMEFPSEPGSLVGPTFASILARQFRSLKYGDRFFYTHGYGPHVHPLSDEQLEEVSKFSLAKLICANVDDPEKFLVQPFAMIQPNQQTNRLTRCRDLPDTDVSTWIQAATQHS
ncbi:chorion peroxidase-like [Ixodes scapularis]|uniref:chorion peroxidase-like n=1 Tax=Ixodes scapularis TaxID=6945 RepID=UPI001AD6877F|nr:chorion peroxidase-like [Ixodes scapularis]